MGIDPTVMTFLLEDFLYKSPHLNGVRVYFIAIYNFIADPECERVSCVCREEKHFATCANRYMQVLLIHIVTFSLHNAYNLFIVGKIRK